MARSPQAQVTAGGMKQTTGADGMVTIALPPGRVDVVVTKADFDPGAAQVDVRAGTESRIEVDLEPESELEENVVVSATRTEQRIEDIPLRVEVVPAEEVGEKIAMSPGNVSMLLGETNGLRMQTTSPALGGASLRIQGLSGRYSQILSDGLPLYGAQSGSVGILQIPPMDLAQVEVIKGVASALYGMSAIGGVVNLVSAPAQGRRTRGARESDEPPRHRWRVMAGAAAEHALELQRPRRRALGGSIRFRSRRLERPADVPPHAGASPCVVGRWRGPLDLRDIRRARRGSARGHGAGPDDAGRPAASRKSADTPVRWGAGRTLSAGWRPGALIQRQAASPSGTITHSAVCSSASARRRALEKHR